MEQTVYSLVETRRERCDLDINHDVSYFLVKRIFLVQRDFYETHITALHYTHSGMGTVQVAYDYQGRRYERKPHWDGYMPWRRTCDGAIFSISPSARPAKDVYGRVI